MTFWDGSSQTADDRLPKERALQLPLVAHRHQLERAAIATGIDLPGAERQGGGGHVRAPAPASAAGRSARRCRQGRPGHTR